MTHYHTIIVGAGPAGLACGAVLARHGQDVLLLERKPRVGPKVCAGGVTWSGYARHLPPELIERSFYDQHIYSGLQCVKLSSPHPIISTVDRERLGQWMRQKAEAAGVTIRAGTMAKKIGEDYLCTDTGNFGYKYLVGADGSNSMVRRYLKIPVAHTGIGIHYLIPRILDKMEWHFEPGLFNNGYAWIFPHKNVSSVGVYTARRDAGPKRLLNSLKRWAGRHGMDTGGCRPRAALINFDYRGWRFGNKFLVGDAAGLASALTGEGIYPAVLSGETAARTILDENYAGARLNRLILKQKKHLKLLCLSSGGGLRSRLILEASLLALRLGLVRFDSLEMGA